MSAMVPGGRGCPGFMRPVAAAITRWSWCEPKACARWSRPRLTRQCRAGYVASMADPQSITRPGAGTFALDMKPRKLRLGWPRRAAAKCSSQNASCRPLPTAITFTGSARTFSDRVATSYGLEGWVGGLVGLLPAASLGGVVAEGDEMCVNCPSSLRSQKLPVTS